MKSILFATSNQNKVSRVRNLLQDEAFRILSLDDIEEKTTEPEENLHSCIGIAAQKALGYLDQVNPELYVLTQDDTLQFLGVSPEDNPGMSIKAPVVAAYGEFNDKNAIKYYSELVKKYGHPIDMVFEYGHCIAKNTNSDESRPQIVLYSSQSKLKARMVSTVVRPEQVPGYFISSMMEVNLEGKWVHFMDLSDEQKILADADIKQSIKGLLKRTEIE